MRILLLVSGFNGLAQRTWCELRRAGHHVTVEFSIDEETMVKGVEVAEPDLILCPFLKERVPEQIWRHWRTIIIHPGPVGDRGPSSLDWAIMRGAPRWGVTALQAVQEMDAGPVWAYRTFAMPAGPVRKSELYNGAVTDAALECIHEVVGKAADPAFVPTALEEAPRPVPATALLPMMRQSDRAFSWQADSHEVVRRIRAADGAPGVRALLAGHQVHLFDVHPAAARSDRSGDVGTVLARTDDAVEVATGDGSVWIGHLRMVHADGSLGPKLPATALLGEQLGDLPYTPDEGPALVAYQEVGEVGELRLQAYNGALSTQQCWRLYDAVRMALAAPTRVLVVRGSGGVFCNGIHLNVIEASADPAAEAWANIQAINAVCRLLLGKRRQELVTVFDGNAGAGGVMLGLTGDVVIARSGVVLNPFYDMGLSGSELHTYTLPLRVGEQVARQLLQEKLPVDAQAARGLGMVDEIGPGPSEDFDSWLADLAARHAAARLGPAVWQADRQLTGRPLGYYEVQELAEMSRDMFDDRSGFAAARSAFVRKQPPGQTPPRLALHRR